MHVTLDATTEVGERWTIRGAHDFCQASARRAGFEIISGPHVTAHTGTIHAIAILAESHVAVQLNKRTGEAHLELFSGRDFDPDGWAALANETFGLRESRRQIQERTPP